MKNAFLITIATVAAVTIVASARGTPPAPDSLHGAAPTDTQLAQLDKLALGGGAYGPDPAIWNGAVPKDNAPTPERIALGRKLYFEKALSKDKTVACATCHDVTRSFTDRRAVSEGVAGQLGHRNAPTTMNAALLHSQFLDGRAATLEAQAGQPILNPVEMAMPNREAAVAALKAIPEYGPLFKGAYGREINYADVERALAAFERTLLFLDAPFDRFLGGTSDAISADARAGFDLFIGKARCVSCHPFNGSNPLGSDNRFHNIGVSAHKQNFESLAKQALAALKSAPSERKLDELAVGTDLSELGRFMVTKNYADVGSFRTSQLRNIGITAPYMHDGSMETLWDVMDHYNKGGEVNAFLDGAMEPLALSETEIDQVVAFLFTWTDVQFAELNRAEMARQKDLAATRRPFRDEAVAQRKVFGLAKARANAAVEKTGGER